MEAATKIGPDEDVASGQESRQPPNKLPAMLGLAEAQSLRDTLAALLSGGPLLLDASAVERMSTPCAQVLLAAGRAAGLAGSSFQVVNASEVFQAALDELGLKAEFKKWMV